MHAFHVYEVFFPVYSELSSVSHHVVPSELWRVVTTSRPEWLGCLGQTVALRCPWTADGMPRSGPSLLHTLHTLRRCSVTRLQAHLFSTGLFLTSEYTPSLTLTACDAIAPHSGTLLGFFRACQPRPRSTGLYQVEGSGKAGGFKDLLPPSGSPSPDPRWRTKAFSRPKIPHPSEVTAVPPHLEACSQTLLLLVYSPGSESNIFQLQGLVITTGWG